MGSVPCRLGLLLSFALLGSGCMSPGDTVLVPDQASGAQASSGTAGITAREPSSIDKPPMSSTRGGSQSEPSPAAMSGRTAGRAAEPPANTVQPDAGNAGAGGVGGAAMPVAGMGEDAGAAGTPSGATQGAAEPDCDFNGVWLAKQLTVSEALGLPQTSNNWFYLELQQQGHDAVVTKALDCGVEVQGTATVTLSRATMEATMLSNSQVGRKATLQKADGKCSFETTRLWKVRGADEQRYMPNETRDSLDSIAQVAANNPLPTVNMTDGAVDTEGDGKLGMAFQVAGVITGTRNSVQREWSTWFTEPGFEIEPAMDWPNDLTIRSDFDNEESILDPASGLLAAVAQPSRTAKHQLKLRFVGRDPSDPRAAPFIMTNDIDTCYALQDAMKVESL